MVSVYLSCVGENRRRLYSRQCFYTDSEDVQLFL